MYAWILGCETPELARFMGPKGILDAGEFELRHSSQAGVDMDPSYYSFSFPAKMREEYLKQWHAEHDPATRQRTDARRHGLQRTRLGRHASALERVLPVGEVAQSR